LRKAIIVTLVAAFVLAIPGIAGAKEVVKATSSNTWNPKKARADVDEKVVWKNPTSVKHTVTGKNFNFNEKLMPGEKTSFTFDSDGTYKYKCKIHDGMDGRIIVS